MIDGDDRSVIATANGGVWWPKGWKSAMLGALLAVCFPSSVRALDLGGTLFDEAARAYGLDALLIYAVALVESGADRGGGRVAPYPWTLRAPGRPFRAATKEEAGAKLAAFSRRHGHAIDVGLMQVNLHWHGRGLASPADLLDPRTNLMVGARILSRAIASAPEDFELGVGRYHTWRDEGRARRYGRRVLTIYRRLRHL